MFCGVSQKTEGVIKLKKFMSFLLSALLVFSLTACESNGGARSNDSESSAGSTASSEAESSAAATEEATATPEPTEEPSAQPTLEETVLLDEGGIKVTATGLTDYGLGGAPDLKLHVENNTNGDITIQTSEYAAVNGCMIRGIASIQASAGDSADDIVMFLDDEFEEAGIETVSDIKLAVRAIDADWNEICASDFVTVKTSAYGAVETPAVNGDVLYDEGGEITQCSFNAELLAGTRRFTQLAGRSFCFSEIWVQEFSTNTLTNRAKKRMLIYRVISNLERSACR